VKISDLDDEARFTEMLTSLLDEHKDVVSMLADGFYQSRDYIAVSSYSSMGSVPADQSLVISEGHLAVST